MNNAARCLHAVGAAPDIKVYPGAAKPLLRATRHDPEIHGVDGLGGVEGLPAATDAGVISRVAKSNGNAIHAIEGIASAIRSIWKDGAGTQVTVISTGPMTNIALFVSVYPELLLGIGGCISTHSLRVMILTFLKTSSCLWAAASAWVTVPRLQVCYLPLQNSTGNCD